MTFVHLSTARPSDRQRLLLLVVVSMVLHTALLWQWSFRTDRQGVATTPPDIRITLQTLPAAPARQAPLQRPVRNAPPSHPAADPNNRFEQVPTPDTSLHPEDYSASQPAAPAASDALPGGRLNPPVLFRATKPPLRGIDSQKLENGHTRVRTALGDGRVRCFEIREPNPLDEHDMGAVYASGC
ncbi:MAG: hypothetical protein HY308_12630 [Gammaproteobacteria bacterium]|nr:hypothetical protein [Gammaproteobacteria bacterium]